MTDLIKSVSWSESEHKQYESELAEVTGLLRETSIKLYGRADVHRLRKEFLQGTQRLGRYKRTRRAMERLLELETVFLSAFVRLAKSVAQPVYFNNRDNYPLDLIDYEQEALVAVAKSCCHYNGKNRFSTFVVHTISRHLIDVLRQQSLIQWNFGRRLLKKREVVCTRMSQGDPLEDALRAVPVKDRAKLAASFSRTVSLPQEELLPSIRGDETKDYESLDVKAKINQVKALLPELSGIKRQLVETFLRGDNITGVKMTSQINPNTGRPYTRMWLSKLFQQACQELKAKAA
jgi:DNA-directed RNA polymerase specialized sigma24 family protein